MYLLGMTNEAFARIKIDQLLKDADWRLTDGLSVRYEYPLDDGGRADYVLFDRLGRTLAVLEAKSTSNNLSAGETQGRRYADHWTCRSSFFQMARKSGGDSEATRRLLASLITLHTSSQTKIRCRHAVAWRYGSEPSLFFFSVERDIKRPQQFQPLEIN
jgi:hypothetical protein